MNRKSRLIKYCHPPKIKRRQREKILKSPPLTESQSSGGQFKLGLFCGAAEIVNVHLNLLSLAGLFKM